MPDGQQRDRPEVFISYAHADASYAREIWRVLVASGILARLDQPELSPGEPWPRRLEHEVADASVLVAVLPGMSPENRVTEWAEVARAVQRRGTDVIPVFLPPSDLDELAGWPAIEYSGSSAGRQLAQRIRLCAAIDLADITGSRLEALVQDLLQSEGWVVGHGPPRPDQDYDLRAVRNGPRPDINWPRESLIQVRAYDQGRVSVGAVHQMAEAVRRHQGTAGLLVTNGQLTSVAVRAAREATRAGTPIEVMDGPALRQMLLENPGIARRHGLVPDPGASE